MSRSLSSDKHILEKTHKAIFSKLSYTVNLTKVKIDPAKCMADTPKAEPVSIPTKGEIKGQEKGQIPTIGQI